MKKGRRAGGLPKEVLRVQRLVCRWRATRKKRGRMPEELWREAVEAARRHGVYRTAKASGLCYESLKRRTVPVDGERVIQQGCVSGGFVEVSPGEVLGCSHEAMATVEMARSDGVRVVVRIPSGAQVDVAGIFAAVCGGGP